MTDPTFQNTLRATLLGLALSLAGCAGTSALRGQDAASPEASRLILVTVQQSDTAARALIGAPGKRYMRRGVYGPEPSVERTISQIVREYGLARVDGWPIASLGVYCEVLEVPTAIAIEELLADLLLDPRIEIAQRMNFFDTLAIDYDDPYLDLQSGIARLGLQQAHATATGKDVVVAVIDSAIDTAHPDLKGRVGMSRNLVDRHKGARRGEVHGTAVAGIIASVGNNHEGIVGVAPDVTLAALRACWSVAEFGGASLCSSFSLAQALQLAIELVPNVINLSLAGPPDPLLSLLLDQAIQRGIVIVAADPWPAPAGGFPTSHADVIAVQAPNSRVEPQERLLLAAPGEEILTTTPKATYSFLSGNSLAAAHVTGVVALLKERNPSLGTAQIAALLSATATVAGGTKSINACLALQRLDAQVLCAN
jgi:hypothetical protein